MTLKEFIKALSQVPYHSSYEGTEQMRGTGSTKKTPHAYAIRLEDRGHIMCPITAVCEHKLGISQFMCDWRIACKDLGLPKAIGLQIIESGDHLQPIMGRKSVIRSAIMKALKLGG